MAPDQSGLQATFVLPWYGESIPGGAEAAARRLIACLTQAKVQTRVLATWTKGLGTDWDLDHFEPGENLEHGVRVHRFAAAPRERSRHNALAERIRHHKVLSAQEEHDYFAHMVHSPSLLEHLAAHPEQGPFFFIPYLFTTSVWGPLVHPKQSVIIPCLHNEGQARLTAVAKAMEAARTLAFNSTAEMELAQRLYDLEGHDCRVMGLGVDTEWQGDAARFRATHGIEGPFILYAGRKDAGKNVPLLVDFFLRYLARGPAVPNLKLVMIGNLEAPIPPAGREHIIDLGFVPMQDKYDAYAAAKVLVQPSFNESFSFVIMEAWLAGTPVMVNRDCAVTRRHVEEADGGLYFSDFARFAEGLDLLLTRPEASQALAASGRRYVEANYTWPKVTQRYLELIKELAAEPIAAPAKRPKPEAPAEPQRRAEPLPKTTRTDLQATFVTPWYGAGIAGGAEAETRRTAQCLAQAGVKVRVLTTSLAGLGSDWQANLLPLGESIEDGVSVMRFAPAERDLQRFSLLNLRIINGETLSPGEEEEFFANQVHSPKLMAYLQAHPELGPFFFIPYLFTTSVWGPLAHPARSVIIPCLHDEGYARMAAVHRAFEASRAMVFHVPEELGVAAGLCDLEQTEALILGEGVDSGWQADAGRFRRAYDIDGPFILYAGRKDATKNVPLLIRYFMQYIAERHGAGGLKLLLMGNLPADIPSQAAEFVKDLGFVEVQDKYDAYAAAELLVQPSLNESFSLVIMESWLAQTPVLVHGHCAVTKGHVERCGGGLHFSDYMHFAQSLDLMLERPELRERMAEAGRRYVLDNYTWPVITGRYLELVERLCDEDGRPKQTGPTKIVQARPQASPKAPAVHQVVPEFAYGDAIGGETLALRKLLRSWGLRSEVYAKTIDRRLGDSVRPVAAMASEVKPRDLVLGHFSIGHDFWEGFGGLPGRKVLRYHNITPAEFIEPVHPEVAERCRRGREQLAALAPRMELGLAVSAYNALDLEQAGCPSTAEMPILMDMSRLSTPPDPLVLHRFGDGPPVVLHVGRMVPNKKLEDLLKTQYWLSRLVPGVRLLLVGNQKGMEPYLAGLRDLMARLRVPGVHLVGHVSNAALNAYYQLAGAYLCLSEHEGFCVPLIESMHFGLPIVAYGAAAVPGTLGDGGILLMDKDPVETAEVVARVLTDDDLAAELARRGRERLEAFQPDAVAEVFRQVLVKRLGVEVSG